MLDRERVRQALVHAAEDAAHQALRDGTPVRALGWALLALEAGPLRESAHRLVIQAHLAEGNLDEAWRYAQHVRTLLRTELGVAPSPQLEELLGGGGRVPNARVTRDELADRRQAR
jgi:DNA-binding SARP family transcriptional activator